MSKRKPRTGAESWATEAAAVRKGDGSPRFPEQIERDIAVALHRAYTEGQKTVVRDARERALREHRAIVEGMRQTLDARARTLEQELAEFNKNLDDL